MLRSFCILSLMTIACLCLVACGGGRKVADVEGVVKINGQPAEKIRIQFWPEKEGPRSQGVTNAEGRFTLTTEDNTGPGAAIGPNKITLLDLEVYGGGKIVGRAAEDTDLSQGKKSRINLTYNSPNTSGLSKEVEAGKKNEFEFDVKPLGGK